MPILTAERIEAGDGKSENRGAVRPDAEREVNGIENRNEIPGRGQNDREKDQDSRQAIAPWLRKVARSNDEDATGFR